MADFSLSRSTTVAADPATVHSLLDDFRAWQTWSPWEGLDPDLQRTYSGPERGVGSRYEWSGNSKAGQGSMQMVRSDATGIDVDLRFLKPFKARNATSFELTPVAGGTKVVWTMAGSRNPLMHIVGRLYFDRAIGRDFDRGLAALKARAEQS